jgi:hypothetical protein
MSDSAFSYASSAPPPPNYEPQTSRRYAPAAGSNGDDSFSTALRDVHGRDDHRDPDEVRRSDRKDGDDKKKRRKGEGDASASAAAGAGEGGGGHVQARGRDPEGKTDILSGLMQHPGGLVAAASDEPPPPANEVDPAQFAQMLEQAAARAEPLQPNQVIQVRFTDLSSPLQEVQVSRLPDGSLGMTVAATDAAVPEVSRSLETLRRRLEAKGVNLGELKMAEEKDLAPEAVEAATSG